MPPKRKAQTTLTSPTPTKSSKQIKFRASAKPTPSTGAPPPTDPPPGPPPPDPFAFPPEHPVTDRNPLHFPTRDSLINRTFYPPEISNAHCAEYTSGARPTPHAALLRTLADTHSARAALPPGDAVVFWFRRDLRLGDNKALSLAAAHAKHHHLPLVALYLLCPEEKTAHLAAPARVDFDLRSARILQSDLAARDIPLVVRVVPRMRDVPAAALALARQARSARLYAGIELEVDELRRDARAVRLGLADNIAVHIVSDACVVDPAALRTQSGRPFSVYSPWFRAWVAHLHAHPGLLDEHPAPGPNPAGARDALAPLFAESDIPDGVEGKALPAARRTHFAALYPAGEHAARARLQRFLKEAAPAYAARRNEMAAGATAMLSVHLAAGTLGARECVRAARAAAGGGRLDAGDKGVCTWISEVAWRDFYRHVLVAWPFVWYVCRWRRRWQEGEANARSMNKCFKPEYTDIEWEYNDAHFRRWCDGTTGFPVVDAAMRQCRNMGYIHNRARMIVASFLSKDLLLDWRMVRPPPFASLVPLDRHPH